MKGGATEQGLSTTYIHDVSVTPAFVCCVFVHSSLQLCIFVCGCECSAVSVCVFMCMHVCVHPGCQSLSVCVSLLLCVLYKSPVFLCRHALVSRAARCVCSSASMCVCEGVSVLRACLHEGFINWLLIPTEA